MKDTLYLLLNHDASELPTAEPISDQEVMNIMKRFKEENHTPSVKTKRKPKLSVVLIAAAVSIACVGTATAAAARLGVFSRLNHAQEQTFEWNGITRPLDKNENRFDYDPVAENAIEIPEVLKVEGENLAVNVDEVYCDGCTTIIGLSGSLKDGNPDRKRLLNLNYLTISADGHTYDCYYAERPAWLGGNLILDEGTENQFSGAIQLVNFGDRELKDETTLAIKVGTVSEQEHYMDDSCQTSKGFTLAVNVTPDKTLRHNKVYTVEENGYSVRFYEIAPAMMIVGFHSDDDWSSWLYDENRQPIEQLGFFELPDYGDGFSIGCMPPITNGTLIARFWDKSGDHGMPDDNGYFPAIKEITINMDDIYTALGAE